MNRLLTLVSLSLTAVLLSYGRAPADDPAVSAESFLPKALAGGLSEVKFSELADKRAASADVKEFAKMMIADHAKVNTALMDFAKQRKLAVVEGLEKNARETLARLSSLSGADFDREYMKVMVSDHEDALKLFEAEAKNGNAEDLKKLANDSLPDLKDHLKRAREIADKVK